MLLCKSFVRVLNVCVFLAILAPGKATSQIMRIDSVAVGTRAARDTAGIAKDTTGKKKMIGRDPDKATIRSAIIPGWGQIYNHKYWKVPLVYGALVTCGFIFNYNLQQYKFYRNIYSVVIAVQNGDSTRYKTIDPIYYQFSPEDIQYARNAARQYVDYSALAFILIWGLNVIDATIDAHLDTFDVSDDLTLKIAPANKFTEGLTGVGLVLDIHKPKHKPCPLLVHPLF